MGYDWKDTLCTSISGVIAVEAERGRSLDPGVGSGRSQDPEAERGRNHDPEAGKENVGSDLVPAQDQDIGIGVEAGVGQGVEVGRCSLSWIKSNRPLIGSIYYVLLIWNY